MLQIFLGNTAELLCFKAGKAGGVRQSAAADLKNLDLAGRVAAAAQLLADLAVSRFSAGASVLSSVDLPTPELPQKAQR